MNVCRNATIINNYYCYARREYRVNELNNLSRTYKELNGFVFVADDIEIERKKNTTN